MPAGGVWFRVHSNSYGFSAYNPVGDARFSPFDSEVTGERVTSYYVAENASGALLESVFHDVMPGVGEEIAVDLLRHRVLVHVAPTRDIELVDLRDPVLASLGVPRDAIVSSPSEHYPCTRRVARHFEPHCEGLLWHSRQAEFHLRAGRRVLPSEVVVVFGELSDTTAPPWRPVDAATISLTVDRGRTMVDQIAQELDVVIVED